ncbi:MAG TPA: DUF6331 family protein [Planctomycetota bacterium]|nr:DUF6331 family protein [Planctomycetota bacterium]
MSTHEIRFGKSLLEMLLSCRTNCSFGCCGLEAAEFTSGQMKEWILDKRFEHREAVVSQLDALIRELLSMVEETAVAHELNAWWPKDKAVAFFNDVRGEFDKAIKLVKRP